MIRRSQRALAEQVLDVRQDELLMLLLVLDPELDDAQRAQLQRTRGQQLRQPLRHHVPILVHLFERGPGQQTALGARDAGSERVVVRVE
jgi:hypothetical protein